MKDPLLIGKIVSAMTKACKLPVTIKIRSGFDSEHINAPEVAQDRKSTRLNSSHGAKSRMPSSA